MALISTLSGPLPLVPGNNPVRSVSQTASGGLVNCDARRWFTLAVGSLVVAGLLSLAVVIGRLPVLSRIIDDPLFFKRCLVVHVDLALGVWFYAFLAGLLSLNAPASGAALRMAAFVVSLTGVFGMLGGALARGAQPVLANYVPVIDHPLFSIGLALFCAGILTCLVNLVGAPATPRARGLSGAVAIGLRTAAVGVILAGATWVSARAGLPIGLDVATRAEFLAWGPGHVLQAANACAMLAVWLWSLERATDAPVLSRRAGLWLFGALMLPQAFMPLLTIRGTMDALYHTGATQLMRWAIFPAVLVGFGAGVRHLHRHRAALKFRTAPARVALTGFAASAALAVLGMVLGACIRSSTTLVPAHYHASLGAVTVAFMTAAYLASDRVYGRSGFTLAGQRVWGAARWQLAVFGVGQTIFVLGFAIGGAYGLGRKTYAAEQHVRSAGEFAGLIVMGVGGLIAVIGGLWFLFLILREIRRWWQPRPAGSCVPAPATPLELTLP